MEGRDPSIYDCDIDLLRLRMKEERAGLHSSSSDDSNTTSSPPMPCAGVPPVGVPEGELEDTP